MQILDIRYGSSLLALRGIRSVKNLGEGVLRRIRRRCAPSGKELESPTDQHNRLILTRARKLGCKAEELPTKFLRMSDRKKVIFNAFCRVCQKGRVDWVTGSGLMIRPVRGGCERCLRAPHH